MLQRMLLSLLLLIAILAPTAGHAESCSSWSTNSSTFLYKLDPAGAELPGWTYTRSGGATTLSLDGSNLLIGEFQSWPNVGLLMFGTTTAGAGPTSTREPYAPPGGATVLSEGRVAGTGAGRYAVWTSFAPLSSGSPRNPTCFVALTKTAPTTVATLVQSRSIPFPNPGTAAANPINRFTVGAAITDNYQTASLTGRQLMVGYLRYYTTCTPSCTGLTSSQTWVQRAALSSNASNAAATLDTTFRTNYLTRSPMVPPLPDREEGQVIALDVGAGYLVGGYGHIKANVGFPPTPAYSAILMQRIPESGSMLTQNGGVIRYHSVSGVMGTYNEARVYQIAPYGTAGAVLVLGTVRDTTAATPFARRERAFLLRTTGASMNIDTAFGTGGVAPVFNDNGTVGYQPQNFAVSASGAITVAINSAAGTGNGIRVQRFTPAGQPDLVFSPAGLKVLPLTGCANPFVDALFVALDSAGNAYLTGSGRTN